MISVLYFATVVATALPLLALAAERGQSPLLLASQGDDDDVKIVTGPISGRWGSDTGEREAEEYAHQKQNGNVFKANRLGEELAKPLSQGDKSLLGDAVTAQNIGQLYFLYGFAVRSVIAQDMNHSLLSDTVLRSFRESVKATSSYIYEAIHDSVPDTIYRLCQNGNWDCIGEGFAKLCSEEGNPRFIELGKESFESYCQFIRQKLQKVEFED